MKILTTFIIIFFLSNILHAKNDKDEIINKISKNLRCLICQGQLIYDSQSDFATSMKLVIRNKLDDGLSENEKLIYDDIKGPSWSPEKKLFYQSTLFGM